MVSPPCREMPGCPALSFAHWPKSVSSLTGLVVCRALTTSVYCDGAGSASADAGYPARLDSSHMQPTTARAGSLELLMVLILFSHLALRWNYSRWLDHS